MNEIEIYGLRDTLIRLMEIADEHEFNSEQEQAYLLGVQNALKAAGFKDVERALDEAETEHYKAWDC